MSKVKRYLKEIYRLISKPQMRVLPGQLAFFFLMSIIPLLALLGNLATYFSVPLHQVQAVFSNKVSHEVVEMIYNLLTQPSGLNLFLFYITAFYMSSNAANAIIITANSIYNIEQKSFLRNWAKAIFMMVNLVFVIIIILLVPMWGDKIVSFVGDLIKSDTLRNNVLQVYKLFKYPFSIITIYLGLKVLYAVAPSAKIKSSTTSKGALFTTTLWLLVTEFYNRFINTFTNYNLFYGSLANILALFLWLYIISYIFILGMAINSRSYLSREEKLKMKI